MMTGASWPLHTPMHCKLLIEDFEIPPAAWFAPVGMHAFSHVSLSSALAQYPYVSQALYNCMTKLQVVQYSSEITNFISWLCQIMPCRMWDDMELSEDEELWAEMRQFWSDEEDDGDVNRTHWKRLRRGQQRSGSRRAPRAPGAGRQRHSVITHYNAVTQVPCLESRCTDFLVQPQALLTHLRVYRICGSSRDLCCNASGSHCCGSSLMGDTLHLLMCVTSLLHLCRRSYAGR